MVIKSLKLKNYRNYDLLDLRFDPNTNILYGDNAQGKTNILEALYLSGTTKSHRGNERQGCHTVLDMTNPYRDYCGEKRSLFSDRHASEEEQSERDCDRQSSHKAGERTVRHCPFRVFLSGGSEYYQRGTGGKKKIY